MGSLTTCLSLLDLLCILPTCCLRLATLLMLCPREGVCHQISHYGRSACSQTLQGLIPETCCFLPDFFLDLPNTCTFLLPKTGHTATVLPLCFCARLSERHAKGPLMDHGGDSPCFTQFLPFSIFSIAHLPFPIFLIKVCNKLVEPTFELLLLNLTPGIHISKNLLSLL